METSKRHWTLGVKLTLVAAPLLLLALVSIGLTLWVSWQLDGGAAAVNEAGRMRMQAYRMSLSIGTGDVAALPQEVREFEHGLALLRHGDPERPLFMPWDDTVRARYATVESHWTRFRDRWTRGDPPAVSGIVADTAQFTDRIDAMVGAIEAHLSRWTTLLHLLQIGVMALAVLGSALLLFMGYLFVLEPVALLKQAIERIQTGDFNARVACVTRDEFGTLAEGFNGMAEHLQSMYRDLEAKVAAKTSELADKRERLEALYDVTSLVARAGTLDELALGFVQRIRRVAHADGVALRWSDEANERYLMLAHVGLPASMVEGEHCIRTGDCHCGVQPAEHEVRVIPIRQMAAPMLGHCREAGFETVVSIPVRLKEHLIGEVDLFFHARYDLTPAERSLLEALTAHLASAIENLRLNALELEAAVSQERTFLARELHDSIAQSLAFMKIQVQLMRDAMASGEAARMQQVIGEIDVGVRECYGDVRELLVHFRTRANTEDIEPALQTTLRKLEHQSGLVTHFNVTGQGLPLPPDVQIQVLHIVQEALSNVRKHAGARRVWLDVAKQPQWQIEVRDDGAGFDMASGPPDETHVGLRIMSERAERIGATLEVLSTPGRGTSVVLTMPLRPALEDARSPLMTP